MFVWNCMLGIEERGGDMTKMTSNDGHVAGFCRLA